MRHLFFILLFLTGLLKAQDKLFFSNGTVKKGIIISITKDFIYFKTTDTSAVQKIDKSTLVLMQDYKGNVYHLATKKPSFRSESEDPSLQNPNLHRNSFGIQPIGIFFGRANFVYERLLQDDNVGIVIPFTLTFDPSFGNIFTGRLIDSASTIPRVKGLNFITGLDINFYLGKSAGAKFFIGPRIRYGTDVAFLNIEGYSIQTQVGLKLSRPDKRTVQHLALGFGFVRVLSSPNLRVVDAKQSYAWYSLTYRIGVKW